MLPPPDHAAQDPRPARGRRRRRLTAAVAALVGLALAAACSAPPQGATGDDGSTVVVVTPDQATQVSFDAGWSSSLDFMDLSLALNETLIRKPYVATDQAGVVKQDLYTFEGRLAESYDVSPDGKTVTFHLRKGVMSEHGNELTADDVIWSYERKFGSPTSVTPYVVAPALTDPAKQFTKVDQYTVSVTVPSAGDTFTLLSTMADITGQIYDSTYLKQHVTADDPWATKYSSGRFDFGFGPYRVESQTAGTETVLTANPTYALGEPKVKRIIRRVVADPANRASALRSGDADIALGLRASDQTDLAADSSVVVPQLSANNFISVSLTTSQAPFTDESVRQAFAYAIDYDQIVSQAFKDRAEVTNSFLSPDAPGYTGAGLPKWTYDPAKAKQLLAAAGYPNGVDVALTVNNSMPGMEDAAVAIQSAAADAGFRITVDSLPPVQYSDKVQTWKAQASLNSGSAISLSPPYELLLGTTKGSSTNLANWSDDSFYATVNSGVQAGDALSAAAGTYWNAAERIWLGSASTVYIAKTKPTTAMRTTLSGLTWRTDSAVDYTALNPA
ncbi:ABC transporter substrate-binding protein [Pseudonocardia sp. WMMC193]|uniref:ABC transporter substrate-binding protein n=1 Tax=Pseudonocardia sp. WMMC193 TaxID=2911965 RepID=UPI001F172F8E|nr:ABC transporter substrate-binding protein [Pseudonocardia sp. WMMC193]MCF7550001.1 ABC transporter substrate-binding protein [Pseudonocardia sp. WMMC193]